MFLLDDNNLYLNTIAQNLRGYLQQGTMQTLGRLGVFHCYHPQALRQVPLHQPGLVLVVSGVKQLYAEQQPVRYQAGQLMLFGASSEVHIENLPAPGSDYLALAATFTPALLERFVASYGSQLDLWSQPPLTKATASSDLLQALSQWLSWDKQSRVAALGTYHLCANGHCSWFEFAREIVTRAKQAGLIGRAPAVVPIATADYPTRARRPAWSVLDTTKIRAAFGLNLPRWEQGLDAVIGELAEAGRQDSR